MRFLTLRFYWHSRCPLSTQGLRVTKPSTPRVIAIAPKDIVVSLIRGRFQFLRKIIEPSTVSGLIPVGRCKSLCHRRSRGYFRVANAIRLCPASLRQSDGDLCCDQDLSYT